MKYMGLISLLFLSSAMSAMEEIRQNEEEMIFPVPDQIKNDQVLSKRFATGLLEAMDSEGMTLGTIIEWREKGIAEETKERLTNKALVCCLVEAQKNKQKTYDRVHLKKEERKNAILCCSLWSLVCCGIGQMAGLWVPFFLFTMNCNEKKNG